MAGSIGNNNYHLKLDNQFYQDSTYLGLCVLDNVLVKVWKCDYRTKPVAKLPVHYMTNQVADQIKGMLSNMPNRRPEEIKALVDMFIAYMQNPPNGEMFNIEDPKDLNYTKNELRKMKNDELYAIGVKMEFPNNPDVEWNKRMKKEEFVDTIVRNL